MGARAIALAVGLVLVLSLVGAPVAAERADLSEAATVAVAHLEKELGAAAVADVEVTDEYTSAHNGVTHVYLRQRVDGKPVHGAVATVNVQDGVVVYSGHRFLTAPAAAASGTQTLTPQAALLAAVRAVGAPAGAARGKPSLVYRVTGDGKARLSYNAEVVHDDHWWNVFVDAADGSVVHKEDFVDWHSDPASIAASTARDEDAAPVKAALGGAIVPPERVEDGSSYNVYPMPLESPLDGPRQVVENPASATASPFGWHDTDGQPGAEHTITKGNNVDATPTQSASAPVLPVPPPAKSAAATRLTPSASPMAEPAWTSTTRSCPSTPHRRPTGTLPWTTCSTGTTSCTT